MGGNRSNLLCHFGRVTSPLLPFERSSPSIGFFPVAADWRDDPSACPDPSIEAQLRFHHGVIFDGAGSGDIAATQQVGHESGLLDPRPGCAKPRSTQSADVPKPCLA